MLFKHVNNLKSDLWIFNILEKYWTSSFAPLTIQYTEKKIIHWKLAQMSVL